MTTTTNERPATETTPTSATTEAMAVLADAHPANIAAAALLLTRARPANKRHWDHNSLIVFVHEISQRADDHDWDAFNHALLCMCEGFRRTIEETTGWDRPAGATDE